ncbi:hypothetical protein FE257_004441 [Aspergillus nanangensis]|uniref:Uncharacterized protein n=1 Tax=Aspergillus nanangensis TaxID=2582783 RepID=A0AAD4GZJ4_ASPNN|nr:hypothetical protein FE257_004441 [Aspergillus nanangensis]
MTSSPCSACSWTHKRQKHCNYESHVKLFYEAGSRGVWSLGSILIVKDREASLPTFEVRNIRFIQEYMFMPVPSVAKSGLNNVNIMVENGYVTGIIHWEMSGYLPVWGEYVLLLVASGWIMIISAEIQTMKER